MKKKGEAVQSTLGWILIGLAILVLSVIFIWILKGNGDELIDRIKGWFRW